MSDELDPDSRQVLALARRAEARLPRDKARVRAAVLLAVATPAAAAARPVVAAAQSKAWLKVLGLVAIGAAGGSLWLATATTSESAPAQRATKPVRLAAAAEEQRPAAAEPERAPPASAAAATVPARAAERPAPPRVRPRAAAPAAPEVALPEPVAAAQVAVEPAPSAPVAGSVAPPSRHSIAEELAALRRAQRALVDGDAARALREVDHVRDTGLLAERSALEVFALCALGRVAEARARAATFRAHAPQSPLLPRVNASCAHE